MKDIEGKDREFYTIRAVLVNAGYTKVTDEYIFAVQDYLDGMLFDEPTYTIFDWFRDTKMNYPEDLAPFKEGEDD